MPIKGFQGTSLLDYPGRIASLVFYGGCNLTCPFCHNPDLVLNPGHYPNCPVDDLIDELRSRRSFIDGVVVSGGEPTVDGGLVPFLRQVKSLGLLVKLDSNGLAPGVLEGLLWEKLVDYLAIDLKTSPERYGELHNAPVDVPALRRSLELVLKDGVEYEFRTTCVPGLVEEADIHRIGQAIAGARTWVLQQFVPRHALAESLQALEPHPADEIRRFAALAETYAEDVQIRGL
ncbi:anaerobic ribonucleoside-triphosphate reductase activating protein [Desulfuromonas sp. KJ2020]|uniref:anaerobic ribonucleoside-triphosphate reductase activating protein n=1 Tax=Desulfuromonas sp. KJ2020 TaxID=2919173 RepID=UPI0020A83605|nr:anaerobic ribonucleoside-triphosphate reductase activating protein [Desulfuromonas sp. KJ2020]MCP3175655.1 anaerobic ribonucleoside-triphosphate reductase activating protein [Desulfuromonas sp. KJ2020]